MLGSRKPEELTPAFIYVEQLQPSDQTLGT